MNLAVTSKMSTTTRVIIATEENQECGDFNQCPWLTLLDIDLQKKEITNKTLIANQTSQTNWLDAFLNNTFDNIIIAKNMDGQSEEKFINQNVPPLLGVSGVVETIVKDLLDNTLIYGHDLCDHEEDHANEQNHI